MSDDLIQAFRKAYRDLQRELAEATSRLADAQRQVDGVQARLAAFAAQLGPICSAAGFPVSAILDESSEPTGGVAVNEQIQNPLALPCRPRSLRWYAGQALHRLGGEGSTAAVANQMRRLGFEHSRMPARSNQLEQSLAALPSQVDWIVAGDGRGHLRLAFTP